jgi:hypothetical protein
MYRNKQGEWVVYNGLFSFKTSDQRRVEKRLAKYGFKPSEIEDLFKGAAENDEGVVTISIGFERLYEEGFSEPE